MSAETIWVTVGLAGQGLFFARFLVQWLASEKAGRSEVPVAFWYLSLGGALIVLAYSIYRVDPVYIVGQSCGFFIYARNLYLIHRQRKPAGDSVRTAAEEARSDEALTR